ncbi:SCAN domain-containing protein 3 [Trichonephila clavipes]|nr:SCAN domain-containing protein 3 [Trichonephila clavipes]
MLNGRTELHIFDRGSVIGDRYCEEVLLPHVRLFQGAIGPDFIFMNDNARPHRTLAVEELLESEDITRMDWPAFSPDLNPIEHVWDALGRRIAARLHHPENTQQLKKMLIKEWALLPQEMMHQLVLSMRRRCEATIAILLKMDKWLKRRKFNDDNSDNDNAQVESYEIAELIAVNLKPHNLAEEIILPACRKIVKTMIGGSADIDICKIPLSNDTIHRRIKAMSENIEQNTAKTLANSNFALQVDETTDITGNAQLIAFVRFIHENDIINQFLCCRELPDFTTGKHIFQVISSYLEEIKVSWKSCIGICTDGAPAMTGHLKGFVAHVKELNEDILVTHCFLHREALVTKFLPSDLKIVLEQCVKMVNYIKSRPLKSRLFSKLCQAMEVKYESLLLHTEVRWLSRGKVISRVLKLKDEMKIFFEQNKNYEFVHLLEDKIWLTYQTIFVIFNNINSSMQGPNENILNSTDKLVGFKKQITLWKNKAQEGNLEKFESVPKDS